MSDLFLEKLLSPNHSVDDAGIALDNLDDFVGDVFISVVGNGDSTAVTLVFHHLDCGVHCLQKPVRIDSREDETCFVERFGAFGRSSDADCGERMSDRCEEAAFFRQSSRI